MAMAARPGSGCGRGGDKDGHSKNAILAPQAFTNAEKEKDTQCERALSLSPSHQSVTSDETKRGLRLWHGAHRKATDMAVSLLMDSLLSILRIYELLHTWEEGFLCRFECACRTLPVVCDDGGCVGSYVRRFCHPHG